MQRPALRYWVLWLFLLGVCIIVFLQVISNYNNTKLIESNKSLLNEMRMRSSLRHFESDMLALESNIRGLVINNENSRITEYRRQIDSVALQYDSVKRMLADLLSVGDQKHFDGLVSHKLEFNRSVLDSFERKGKNAAEEVIRTKLGQALRDSMLFTISRFDRQREAKLTQISESNASAGRQAKTWGKFITGIALAAVVLAFWYVLNQGRQQQKIITLLNESDKRSRELAGMKEQFLANMSHEIRTPMNSILGFTNLLRRTELNQQQKEYVQNIHSAGENLLALVNDILDLSKIEAGMMSVEEVRFSLHTLMHSVGSMFREKITEKGLALNIQIDPAVPDVLQGDAVRLTQILVNLMSNAVKFTEQGYITMEAIQVEERSEGVQLQFVVADTGIGIAPEKQEQIFERFQQAEAETTRRFGGTGLGLAIVRQLVLLLGGSIHVESQPGEGSRFFVSLFYKLPDLDQLFSEAMEAHSEPVPVQQIKVLIAEDNAMNQHLISHLMKSWAIDFTLVSNGREAVEALQRQAYSLVLMDLQMPEMDGYKATETIRRSMRLDVPVIAMTAHAMAGEKERCLQLGMNDYVSKPIKETELYTVIARHAQGLEEKEHKKLGADKAGTGLVNLDYLHELSGNDPDFERQILEQFIIQAPQELEEMERSFEAGDFDQLRRVAHSLKSTIGYVGLSGHLNVHLQWIEDQAADNSTAGVADAIQQVKTGCAQAVVELEALL
jgi:signal transduction histidine kinase/DNA-binding response OmpR family regulator